MSCKVEQTEKKVIQDPNSCVICRDHPPNQVPLEGGVDYPKCSVIIEGETKFAPKTLLTNLETQCDKIYGIMTCHNDLTDETAETLAGCKFSVLTTGEFDPYYVCWPEGTTKELIDAYACQAKCCLKFRFRTHCTEMPEEYQYRLESVRTEAAKAAVKTIPVKQSKEQPAA